MKRAFTVSGICLALILILFVSTDPNTVPSFVLVLPFLLLFALLLSLFYVVLQKRGMGTARGLRISMLCAGIPIVLLVLQSIGQLTVRDVLALGALFVISYFYMSRLSATS